LSYRRGKKKQKQMSQISLNIGEAIFSKLNVDAVKSLATGGIFQDETPESVSFPVLLFQRFISQEVVYSAGGSLAYESDEWLIKALTDTAAAGQYSYGVLGAKILAAAENAINESLNPLGVNCLLARRVREMPPQKEQFKGKNIYHQGFILKVIGTNG
jgi:hypothetical protein